MYVEVVSWCSGTSHFCAKGPVWETAVTSTSIYIHTNTYAYTYNVHTYVSAEQVYKYIRTYVNQYPQHYTNRNVHCTITYEYIRIPTYIAQYPQNHTYPYMEVTRVGGENGDNDHHRAVGEIVSQVTTKGDQSESPYAGDKLQHPKDFDTAR